MLQVKIAIFWIVLNPVIACVPKTTFNKACIYVSRPSPDFEAYSTKAMETTLTEECPTITPTVRCGWDRPEICFAHANYPRSACANMVRVFPDGAFGIKLIEWESAYLFASEDCSGEAVRITKTSSCASSTYFNDCFNNQAVRSVGGPERKTNYTEPLEKRVMAELDKCHATENFTTIYDYDNTQGVIDQTDTFEEVRATFISDSHSSSTFNQRSNSATLSHEAGTEASQSFGAGKEGSLVEMPLNLKQVTSYQQSVRVWSKLSKTLGLSSTTGFNWSNGLQHQSSVTVKKTQTITVPRGVHTKIWQLTAVCGIFKTTVNKFQRIDMDKFGTAYESNITF